MEENIRLQKYLAMCNVASRRGAEEIILEKRVEVNGKLADELGTKVSLNDTVTVDGEIVRPESKKVYIMLNKPGGYITSAYDEEGRKTVMDLIEDDFDIRLYPVGRLDYNTEGLLLLTNDGDFTYKLTHPKHNIDKVYHAVIGGIPTEEELRRLRKGVIIDDYFETSPASVKIIEKRKNTSMLEILIHEGHNRQVRKMCEAIGYTVHHLKRVAIGSVTLGNLALGKWRHLTKEEIDYLVRDKK